MFDETPTAQQCRQMNILIRYWNHVEGEVSVRFLKAFQFGHATAEIVSEALLGLEEASNDTSSKNLDKHLIWWPKCKQNNPQKSIWKSASRWAPWLAGLWTMQFAYSAYCIPERVKCFRKWWRRPDLWYASVFQTIASYTRILWPQAWVWHGWEPFPKTCAK